MFPEIVWARPWLGFMLPVFCYIVWRYQHSIKVKNQTFQSWFDAHLFEFLSQKTTSRHVQWVTVVMYIAAICLSIFMAGPAVKMDTSAGFVEKRGIVIVLDLSTESLATDIAPTRLHHARYKIEDLLAIAPNHEYGLVVAGEDAYTIAPLSPDTSTLVSQLPSLYPAILPRAPALFETAHLDKGVNAAATLLSAAGYQSGTILVIGYDLPIDMLSKISEASQNYAIGFWQFGTAQGGPIKLAEDKLAIDENNNIVISRVYPPEQLPNNMVHIPNDSADLDTQQIVSLINAQETQIAQDRDGYNNQWTPIDSYFLFPVLLIILAALKRPQLFLQSSVVLPLICTLLVGLSLFQPSIAHANETTSNNQASPLNIPELSVPMDWRPEAMMSQEHASMSQFNQGNYAQAFESAESDSMKSIALLAMSQFAEAKQLLLQDDGSRAPIENIIQPDETSQRVTERNSANDKTTAIDNYHLGLAQFALKEYEDALMSFEQALQHHPEFIEAQENYDALKQFLEKEQDEGNQDQQGRNGDNQSNENNQQQTEQQQQAFGDPSRKNQPFDDMLAQGNEQRQSAADAGGRGSESTGESADDDTKSDNFFDDLLISTDKTHGDIDEQDIEQTELFGRTDGKPTLDRDGIKAVVRKVPDDPSFLVRQRLKLIERKKRIENEE